MSDQPVANGAATPPRWLAWPEAALGRAVTASAVISAMGLIFLLVSMIREVAGRYLFDSPTAWVDEMAGYTIASMTFLGAAYALRSNELVAMTIVSERMPPRVRQTALAVGFVVSTAILAVVTYQAGVYVLDSQQTGTLSNSTLRVPLWIPRAVMLLGLVILLLETIRQALIAVAGALQPAGRAE